MFKLAEFPPILPTKMQGLDLYSTAEADIYIFNEALVECGFFSSSWSEKLMKVNHKAVRHIYTQCEGEGV